MKFCLFCLRSLRMLSMVFKMIDSLSPLQLFKNSDLTSNLKQNCNFIIPDMVIYVSYVAVTDSWSHLILENVITLFLPTTSVTLFLIWYNFNTIYIWCCISSEQYRLAILASVNIKWWWLVITKISKIQSTPVRYRIQHLCNKIVVVLQDCLEHKTIVE